MIGETILQYQILEKLGAGGMGVVYKALDTRLNRTVAVKFLPEYEQAGDTDRARFLQEARAASAINHPNVCVIYDLKEYEGEQFIVMEYVEGRTLKQLTTDQELIPIEKAVDYALQIADAMQAAHERGILHRDIKSENIMVTASGQIKVMDFGLALVKGSQRLTRSSSTVGTIAYMSPEQIEGKQVDARADIFSFGVVFYELLTGHLPFAGDNQAAVIYAILNNPPMPIENFRQLAPEVIELVYHALEKDVNNRFQSFQEIRQELLRIRQGEAEAPMKRRRLMVTTPARKRNPFTIRRIITGVILLMVLSVAAVFLAISVIKKPKEPMNILPLTTELGLTDGPAFSPDARQIAYHWRPDLSQDANIYIQQISSNQRLRLTSHPDDDVWPAWSPDGQYIAFCRQSGIEAERGLYIISSIGGNERKVHQALCQHPCWSPDGKSIVFVNYENGCVTLLDLTTGKEKMLSHPKTIRIGFWIAADPEFSPDGKSIAYVRIDTFGTGELYIVDLEDGSSKKITSDNAMITGLSWMPDGKTLVFSTARATSQKLWSISRYGSRLKLLNASGQNSSSPTVTQDGRRLAFVEQRPQNYKIGRIRINHQPIVQHPEKVIATQRDATFLNISPDGQAFTFNSNRTGYSEIWKCESSGNNLQQLTYLNTHSGSPQWSPDGSKITFDTRPYGNGDIYIVSSEGGTPVRMTSDPRDEIVPTWSSDGTWIYYAIMDQNESQIWKVPLNGGAPVQVTQNGGLQALEAPDGRVLYVTKEGGGYIWQCDLDGSNERMLFYAVGADWRDWTIKEEGIYFLAFTNTDSNVHARLYNFQTKKIEELAILPMLPDLFNPMPSFDRKWLYVSYMEDLPQSEIILVENFQ